MQIFHDIKEIQRFENTLITIGTFDGVHIGHQKMIQTLIEIAKNRQLRHLLITFDPHPLQVLKKNNKSILLLTTDPEKMAVFEQQGLENVLFMPFTQEIAALNASQFIESRLIQQIGLKGLVIGFNHTLGHDRSGTAETLSEISNRLEFELYHVPQVRIDRQIVSSTRIREALLTGDVESAYTWLGRPYSIWGNVIQGKRIGRELGFPTANLDIPDLKLIPKDGVYAVLIRYESQVYTGLANIGHSPTIPGKSYGVEIYIDNFSEIIYNKCLAVEFIGRLRDEIKFESSEAMIQQIEKDQKQAQNVLATYIRRS